MPNMDGPAGTDGGNSGTSGRLVPDELPAKLRVHALAKLLGRSSREVLDALNELGKPARGPQSSVDRAVAIEVEQALLGAGDVDEVPQEVQDSLDATPAVVESAEQASPFSQAAPRRAAKESAALAPVFAPPAPLFQSPTAPAQPVKSRSAKPKPVEEPVAEEDEEDTTPESTVLDAGDEDGDDDAASRRRRRRGRRGRGRGKGGQGEDGIEDSAEETETAQDAGQTESDESADDADSDDSGDSDSADDGEGGNRRRRRRRRRKGAGDDSSNSGSSGEDDPPNTVVHVRDAREAKAAKETSSSSSSSDEVRSVRGSTRLEAKRQRRRDGREAGRRRVPILSESEFLARREAVDRKMVVHERGEVVQIGVTEDGVLVEHFVTSYGSGSLVGNVYLGRVQNVLPSMEAAFVDIGRGRNAVLYAGEVDWDAAGLEGKARKIEQALSTGDSVLVQVTKDPVGHKGARLTTQISLPGRFLVYVPGGGATGISRKLPDNERKRLKDVLKRIVPEDAGVIIRTASEGVSEEELGRDVRRLRAQWEIIGEKAGQPKAKAPQLLYEEPDLLIKVVRDLFTEDFSALIVQGGNAWETIEAYVKHVAPDLADRLQRHVGNADVFTEHRIDEQILKALDRKVWLPSGGYLVIDRTEAMTVIDVNTGKFTGSGGNLEETVTRNNLESAEEIVRQLRLRDIGGIIVIDFIDMVLESNRDLVLRRLTECLGRDRTRHQVAEVTSLGLVQMTRKRVGTGLLEAFSTPCEHCRGRGVLVSTTPVQAGNGGGGNGGSGAHSHSSNTPAVAAAAAVHAAATNGGGNGGNGGNGGSNGHTNGHSSSSASSASSTEAPSGGGSSSSSRRGRHRGRGDSRGQAAVAEAPEVIEVAETELAPAADESAVTESVVAAKTAPAGPVDADAVDVDTVEAEAAAEAGAPSTPEESVIDPTPARPDVPLATVSGAGDDAEAGPNTVAVTSNGHWTVVEQPPVTTRVTRRPSRRAASRPAGPPVTSAAPAEDQSADQHTSAAQHGEQAPV
ncbi:MAG TPA: translation initiation factor IF-2 N-terminal domain-containing protein [Pseudonocardiaceae bacterium]|jgi:ribonuclease E|nr:translation initiation factor IF-2 N-terminal domain-containing protein [Pseudonocardiaceae bacterium]